MGAGGDGGFPIVGSSSCCGVGESGGKGASLCGAGGRKTKSTFVLCGGFSMGNGVPSVGMGLSSLSWGCCSGGEGALMCGSIGVSPPVSGVGAGLDGFMNSGI